MLDNIESDALRGAIWGAGLFTAAAMFVGISSALFGGVGAGISIGIVVAACIGAFVMSI